MENKKTDALIVVKQLPIIEEQLKTLSTEIDDKVSTALKMVCTDDTVKDVKKLRAELNKDFKELEAQRKYVKEQVLSPYQKFEEVYKTYVSDKYKEADQELKTKIDSVEDELKAKKEGEIKDYFNEYAISQKLDWLDYSRSNINVTLTASVKSLKEQAKEFVDKVVDDLKLIDSQDDKEEITVEYYKDLNVSRAITTVKERKELLQKEYERKEVIEQQKEADKEAIAKVEAISTPVEEKVYSMTFKVTGTIEQLKQVKKFLEDGGYKYE